MPAATLIRIALAAFVLAWIFGPYALRTAVPVWLPFLVALGLELHFFVGAVRAGPREPPDRLPQAIDRERYGYPEELEEPPEPEEEAELWTPVATPARPVRRFLAGLAVIGGLAAAVWIVERETGWDALDADARAATTARLSAEASRIAGKPVEIRCDESGEHVGAVQHADGVAVVGGTLAYLTPERCLDLYRLGFEGEIAGARTARALAVLAHEAWHLRGVREESTTECYALQSGVRLGRRLGLAPDTARQLMRQQLVENSLRSRSSPEYVVRAECREGGRLDLYPEIGEFP